MKPFLLYFGCWDQAGHYLFRRDRATIYDAKKEGLPFDSHAFDGSPVFLPHPERVGKGALTHVVRGDDAYTVLAWWGSPFDSRGAVNAAIISSGWDTAEDIWMRFSRVYEPLAAKLAFPDLSAGAPELLTEIRDIALDDSLERGDRLQRIVARIPK